MVRDVKNSGYETCCPFGVSIFMPELNNPKILIVRAQFAGDICQMLPCFAIGLGYGLRTNECYLLHCISPCVGVFVVIISEEKKARRIVYDRARCQSQSPGLIILV